MPKVQRKHSGQVPIYVTDECRRRLEATSKRRDMDVSRLIDEALDIVEAEDNTRKRGAS